MKQRKPGLGAVVIAAFFLFLRNLSGRYFPLRKADISHLTAEKSLEKSVFSWIYS